MLVHAFNPRTQAEAGGVPRQPGCWEPGVLSGMLPWHHHQRLPYFIKTGYMKALVPGADSPGYELAVCWLNTSYCVSQHARLRLGKPLPLADCSFLCEMDRGVIKVCYGPEPVRHLCQPHRSRKPEGLLSE